MRIDAHHHVWDLDVRDQDWIRGPRMAPIRRGFSAADLAPLAAVAGVGATVVVQTVADPDETPELIALAERDPLVAAAVGWTDLTAPDVADRLAALRALPGGRRLRAIRHGVQGEADADWLVRPDVLRGLRAVAGAGLGYDLLLLPRHLPGAARAAAEVPELTFVLDHCAKPPIASGEVEPWAADLRALAARPNVACKLSGLVTEADWEKWTVDGLRVYTEIVLDAFGPDRVMFGSDWPVCTLAASYAQVAEAAEQLTEHLSPAERERVRGGTAAEYYRLEGLLN
ncbi:amidohydrolase [Mangrovactinospora gilvigrisea]|uniref:Amidohydrolase n=1 Tax=Mangrovactinospora gilvigrisea TaxID=1428644 RepID=A0A1J7C4G1_9ACTN|nr:amidohydrolase family protein [Mangrovactinospora gilvigrisea]OIV36440.1 amidohydrolase [Mangrovactinospora gilvigrisea]